MDAAISVMLPVLMLKPVLVAAAMAVSVGVATDRPVKVTPSAVTLLLRSMLKPVILAPAVKVRAVPLVLMLRPL